jgi:hypothetical protein
MAASVHQPLDPTMVRHLPSGVGCNSRVEYAARSWGDLPMDQDIDPDRIDDAVLALLWLGLHDGWRTWKGFDWDAMDRLHRKGMISDPVGKAKSVVFTQEGRREAERLFRSLFSRR